jgi:hypothetical protein
LGLFTVAPAAHANTTVTSFWVLCLVPGQRSDFYSAENTIRFAGSSDTFTVFNIGQVNAAYATAAPFPEPSEWLAMGMAGGVSVVGLIARARPRKPVKSTTTAP